jgi:hypothetical protein
LFIWRVLCSAQTDRGGIADVQNNSLPLSSSTHNTAETIIQGSYGKLTSHHKRRTDGARLRLFACCQVAEDKNPKRNYNEPMALFFIVFMVFAYFLIVNLFVGIIMENFSEKRDELKGKVFMTPRQQEWVTTMKVRVPLSSAFTCVWVS